MIPRIGPRRGSVYRIFDSQRVLLYVGTAYDVNARMKQHSRTKQWWNEVERIESVEYDSDYQARIIEGVAIVDEDPKYNITKNATTESLRRFAARATRRASSPEPVAIPKTTP